MQIYRIEWLDTHCEDSWNPIDMAKGMEPLLVTSVGIVLIEDRQKIVLSAMSSERDTVSMLQCIPTKSIIKIKELIEAPGPSAEEILEQTKTQQPGIDNWLNHRMMPE